MTDTDLNLRRLMCWLAGTLLAASAVGCGQSHPKCVAVGGQVTYRGQPVKNGCVTFTPIGRTDHGTLVRPATGDVQADGTYVMKTFGRDEGVLPGDYAVSISVFDYSRGLVRNRVPSAIPTKYESTETSGLKATIPPDASARLQFNFDLTD
jgi:hypothetical protein